MALFITDECTSCDVCVPECPNEAITDGSDADSEYYFIHPELCTECKGAFDEPQCIEVCPVDCIEPDPKNTESDDQLLAKYKKLHPDG